MVKTTTKKKEQKAQLGVFLCSSTIYYLRCITAQPHSNMAECIILFNMMKKQNVANGDVIYASVLQ